VFGKLKELWEPPREEEQLRRELVKVNKELAKANDHIARQRLQIKRLKGGSEDPRVISPENIVWIFGAARTGSTWLSEMMGELRGHIVWREPLVGALFGNLYYERAKHLIGKPGKHYIFGENYRESWLNSIRTFVLKEASGRFPEATGSGNYLVVKEPNGSFGAPLLMEALPESRMILLIRDPRDVTASSMDARSEGGWRYENRKKWESKSLVDKDPDAAVRNRAKSYLQRIEKTRQAYEAHEGRKVLVKYEELRADTLATMRRIYSDLEIPVDEGELARAVEKRSWENIPDEEKGPGKRRRKATAGGWREDLTPEQARIVEEVTRPLLEEFYS
jgi:sulfotransferase family protein